MQIIPNSNVFDGAGVFSAMDMNGASGEDFLSAMNDAFSSVQNNDNFSVSSALKENKESPKVDSPYTRHTTNGVTYTLSEVCFSKQELQELRQALLKEGAPVSSLQQFDILADQPNGATLAQVMASLMGGGSGVDISEKDEQAITALLGQLDPSGALAADALDFMRNGNPSGALDLIQDALGKFGSADTLDVDQESILALGRGLGLRQDALNGLINNFGGKSGLTLSGGQFDALLNPAKNQLMEDAAQKEKLEAALDKTLKPIITKARARMEKEEAASALADRRVAQSKILIDRTVQENSRQIIDDTVTGETDDLRGQMRMDALLKAANGQRQTTDGEAIDQKMATAKTAPQEGQTGMAAKFVGHNLEDEGGSLFDQDQKDSKSSGWQTLLGKIEVKPSAAAAAAMSAMMAANAHLEEAEFGALQPNIPNLPAHVANQVEQGMLMAMRDGSTRLDLQLHPAELGNITITLVARNGELTAQIRSEKTETADMVSRQLDAIRVNLEQQGIKVDKLEVQLQDNQDNRQDSFMNLGEHNARQEADTRRQEMIRMRNLASLRHNGENISDSGLARSVHTIGQTARYAGNALHVVA